MKSLAAFCAFAVAFTLAARGADTVSIKLGTILPKGTTGHTRLMAIRSEWARLSDGKVNLVPMAGSADGEHQIVRQVRNERLQAALVSAVGLAQIDRSATCLQLIPLAFRDWREVDHVREKIRPALEAGLRQKGFEVLFWADAGWVRFFSREQAAQPADMKRMKMFVWTGDPQQLTILRNLGYTPVGLETENILPSLMTGAIDVVPVPPFLANAAQYTKYVRHMVDLNWAPIVGAAVVQRDVWEKIPAALRPKLLAAAAKEGELLRQQMRVEDDDAILAMARNQRHPLSVHRVTPAIAAEWRTLVEKVYPDIRGSIVPAELFDRVQSHLAEFRAANAAKDLP